MNKSLSLIALFILFNLTLFAQDVTSPRIVHTKEKSAIHVPAQEIEAGLKTIYSNLGASRTELYADEYSWTVWGPNSTRGHGSVQFEGMPFTPKANSLVSQVRVAVQYDGSGANQVNLNIYGDSDGVPGTLLAGPVTVTNLPDSATCCTLAIANFTPVVVTGGTQYWVVVNTPLSGKGSDFTGQWCNSARPLLKMAAMGAGSPWYVMGANLLVAGEVLGTIP